MNNNNEIYHDNEIDLKELFSLFWKGKIYIIFFTFLAVFFASLYLHSAERKYTVEYRLKPVSEPKNRPSLSGLGGFASIVGLGLPASTNNDYKIYKELITSEEVSEIIFENKALVKNIFGSEWNESLNKYSKPLKNEIQTLSSNVKKLLTGNEDLEYMPPNPRRLAIIISKNIQIKEDKETGFLKFISQSSQPELILSLIIEATKASDNIMRQRYINFSNEPLAFYKEKIRTALSREHREALAALISKEEQKLMFASRGKYFTAEPYIEPTISLYPTAPKPKLVLLLSLVLGFFIGLLIILLRSAKMKDTQ